MGTFRSLSAFIFCDKSGSGKARIFFAEWTMTIFWSYQVTRLHSYISTRYMIPGRCFYEVFIPARTLCGANGWTNPLCLLLFPKKRSKPDTSIVLSTVHRVNLHQKFCRCDADAERFLFFFDENEETHRKKKKRSQIIRPLVWYVCTEQYWRDRKLRLAVLAGVGWRALFRSL